MAPGPYLAPVTVFLVTAKERPVVGAARVVTVSKTKF